MGDWRNLESEGVGSYLKALGVSWAKRKIAEQFKPEVSWAVVDGVLQLIMPTPLGTRLERFPTDEAVVEADPDGNEFSKRTAWEEGQLVTRAQSLAKPNQPPFITRRWLEGGRLRQINEHDGARMSRVFGKK